MMMMMMMVVDLGPGFRMRRLWRSWRWLRLSSMTSWRHRWHQ